MALKQKERKPRESLAGEPKPKSVWQKGRPSKPYKPKPVVGKRAVDPKTLFAAE
jgi:hypothetical protein